MTKHITNHTVRKVLVKKLKKAGVSNTEITAITGHKGEDSLKHYDEIDIDDHRRISKCLSGDNKLIQTGEVQRNEKTLQDFQLTHVVTGRQGHICLHIHIIHLTRLHQLHKHQCTILVDARSSLEAIKAKQT